MLKPSRFIRASALVIALSAAHSAFAVNCDDPRVRDSTCVGSINAPGANPVDPIYGNKIIDATTITAADAPKTANTSYAKGTNVRRLRDVAIPTSRKPNSCVSAPFTSWAYDPTSYGGGAPSFILPAGSGYIGAGGATPTDLCPSDSDGSCNTWVPASHPYLMTSGSTFSKCTGAGSMGSVSCDPKGAAAYVTANANVRQGFQAFMISCATNEFTPGMKVAGAPFAWWSNCAPTGKCNFFYIFPEAPGSGGHGGGYSADGGAGF